MRGVTVAVLATVFAMHAAGGVAMGVDDRVDYFDTNLLRIDEGAHLGTVVPDVWVTTPTGRASLYELVDGRPTIVLLAYYNCGHTCPVTIQNLARASIETPNDQYRVLVLSFDVTDDLHALHTVADSLEHVPDNWSFGLLPEEANVALTDAVGFEFFFSEQDQVFVHPAVLLFLSADGEVMRYLYGTNPRAADIDLALLESRNRLPTLNDWVDMVKLTCFQFDASKSRYVLHPTIIFGSAGLGLLVLVGLAALASNKTSRGVS